MKKKREGGGRRGGRQEGRRKGRKERYSNTGILKNILELGGFPGGASGKRTCLSMQDT